MNDREHRPPDKTPKRPAASRKNSPTTKPKLAPEIQYNIGQHLRAFYSGVVKEGVPDRFVELLQHLDDQDKGSK